MANDANDAWPAEPLAAAAHAAAARDADDGQGDNQGDNQGDDQGDDDQGDSGALNIAQMSDEMNAEARARVILSRARPHHPGFASASARAALAGDELG
jgi:hypothetical protein